MNDFVEVTGKNVEEAIRNGLEKMNVERDEVKIEIVTEGRKGFLHVGARPAVVKLVKKPSEHEEQEEEVQDRKHTFKMPEKEKNITLGKIWVKNGVISSQNGDEELPTIVIPTEIKLSKNGESVTGEVQISEEDQLKVEFIDEEKQTDYRFEWNKDKTEVKVRIEPGMKTKYKLLDQKPAHKLKLKVEGVIETSLTLTEDMLYEALKAEGVVFGLNKTAIKQACESKEAGEFLVAKGIEPEPGKDGWLEYKVEVNEDKLLEEKEDGSIDFRNTRKIPSVEEGVEIAVLHDPVEGKPGKTVTGEAIPAKPVQPLKIREGKGVSLSENGYKVFSTSYGRPSIEARGKIVVVEVMPKLEHPSDVNLASGNLNFHGDVEVRGNVDENMTVHASRNIEINGSASKAKIEAGKSIFIKNNVISSRITAGKINQVIAEKAKTLEILIEEFDALLVAVHQLFENPAFSKDDLEQRGVMTLVKVLIEQKFSPFYGHVRTFVNEYREHSELLGEHWGKVVNEFNQLFIMMNDSHLKAMEQLDDLLDDLRELHEFTQMAVDDDCEVILPSAMNSQIQSSGNVTIIKQGSYNTNIYAVGFLKIEGFIRGGKLFAGKGAYIKEIGSKGGVPTTVIVPPDQTIEAKIVYADTTIQIGKMTFKFTKERTNIKARLENGRIEVH